MKRNGSDRSYSNEASLGKGSSDNCKTEVNMESAEHGAASRDDVSRACSSTYINTAARYGSKYLIEIGPPSLRPN